MSGFATLNPLWALLAACLIAGCASAPPPDNTREMQEAGACLAMNARELDDRISGADIVARAVVEACGPELNHALVVGTRGQSGAFFAGYAREHWAQAFSAARRYVLQMRAERGK